MRSPKAVFGAAALGFALVAAAPAARGACPSSARGPLSDGGARLSGQWLYDSGLQEARRARTWRYVWTGINGTLAVGSFAAMPFVSRDQRIELAVGGVGSAATALIAWFVPLEIESAPDRRASASTVCEGLRIEEQFAASAAADEAGRVTWPWHVLDFAEGAAYTVIVGVTTQNWTNGLVDGAAAFALGELQLFTQPTRFARQFDAYTRAKSTAKAAWWVLPVENRGTISIYLGATF